MMLGARRPIVKVKLAPLLVVVVAAAVVLPEYGSSQTWRAAFTAPGRIETATGLMSIGTAATGVVANLLVHEGSRVQAGQLLVTIQCRPLEAELEMLAAQLRAAEAVFDRVRRGPRQEEIAVSEAAVGYSQARAEEAEKTFQRSKALQEGVTVTTARVLETLRDARITAAQLREAQAKLAVLRAGSREEDVREAQAKRDAAANAVAVARAQLEQCSARAPVDGLIVDTVVSPGQFLSLAVPGALLHMVQDTVIRVRAEVDLRDSGRLCQGQLAKVTADSSVSVDAEIASISSMVTARTLPVIGTEARGRDVQIALLKLKQGTTLPIGLPVTVHFATCPSKN